jgi:serine/threonine protein kinase/tetratricopeptide (TPR) repeat protein
MIGQKFGHYRIVEQIGVGGMGVVYRAYDERLDRTVAIKVLAPGVVAGEAAQKRFRREALALARINHPNIATLYDTGSENGTDYLVMEDIEGIALSEHIASDPLPISEVLSLAVQICEGLAAAHDRGIVHRDLKPGNMRLTPDRRLKILDFGLAERSAGPSQLGVTITSTQVQEMGGTIPYMAPEQLQGQPADKRSDLWAFGAVLYELSCGQRPFPGDVATAVAADIIHKPPAPPRTVRPEIPVDLERIILKCLEKKPAMRYLSARAVQQDLEDLRTGTTSRNLEILSKTKSTTPWSTILAGIAVLVFGLAIGAWFVWHLGEKGGKQNARRSIAVLQFRNLTGRPSEQWVSTALSEMLTTELAAGEQLRTLPGEDVIHAERDLNIADSVSLGENTLSQLRQRLGSDLVVVGSYLDMNGQMRVDIRLQDAKTGSMVANFSETGTEEQLLNIVSRVGSSLRASCGIRDLTPAQSDNLRAFLPANSQSARLYAEGLERMRAFDPAAAREKFEAMIDADPTNALAHSALSSAWSQLGYDRKAVDEAKKAFDLSRNLSREDSLAIEGAYYVADKKWDKAIESYRTLFAFFPDNVEYGLNLADSQVSGGKAHDALGTLNTMRQVSSQANAQKQAKSKNNSNNNNNDDPRIDLAQAQAATALSDYRLALSAAGQAAAAAIRQGARLEHGQALLQQCWAFRNLGQLEEAKHAGQQAREIFTNSGYLRGQARSLTCIANVADDQGDLALAQQMHEAALSLAKSIGARIDIAGALNNLGNVLGERGKLEESNARYQEAISVATEIGDQGDELRARSNLGNNLIVLGQFESAQKALEGSLAIAREIGDQQGVVESLINLGTVSYSLGDLAKSEKQLSEALSSSRSLGLRADSAFALNALGDIMLAEDKLTAAENNYQEALEISKQLDQKEAMAIGQLSMASLALERDDLPGAENTARAVVQKTHEQGNTEQEMLAHILLAKTLTLGGKLDDAQSELAATSKLPARNETTKLIWSITAGELLARQGKKKDAARVLLEAQLRAQTMKYIPGQFLARLTQIESGTVDTGHRAPQDLAQDATKLGFQLIARKAEEAGGRRPPASAAH